MSLLGHAPLDTAIQSTVLTGSSKGHPGHPHPSRQTALCRILSQLGFTNSTSEKSLVLWSSFPAANSNVQDWNTWAANLRGRNVRAGERGWPFNREEKA